MHLQEKKSTYRVRCSLRLQTSTGGLGTCPPRIKEHHPKGCFLQGFTVVDSYNDKKKKKGLNMFGEVIVPDPY